MRDIESRPDIMAIVEQMEAAITAKHRSQLIEKYGPDKGEELWFSFQPGGRRYELDGEAHEDDPRNIHCGNCYLGSGSTEEDFDDVGYAE